MQSILKEKANHYQKQAMVVILHLVQLIRERYLKKLMEKLKSWMSHPAFNKTVVVIVVIIAVMILYAILKAISIKKKRHHNGAS